MTDRFPRERVIYLSGPYTKPDPTKNMNTAAKITLTLEAKGWLVIVPHMNLVRDLITPMPYDYWIDLDLKLLSLCGAWTRFDPSGESPGSELEKAHAEDLGLVIYNDHSEVPDLRARDEAP